MKLFENIFVFVIVGIICIPFYFLGKWGGAHDTCEKLVHKMEVCHSEVLIEEERAEAIDYCMENRHDEGFMRQAKRYTSVDCGKFWYGQGPHPKD